jgi:hypothetical protein
LGETTVNFKKDFTYYSPASWLTLASNGKDWPKVPTRLLGSSRVDLASQALVYFGFIKNSVSVTG